MLQHLAVTRKVTGKESQWGRNRLVLAWKQSQWPTIVKTEEREVAAEPDKVMVTDDLDKYGLV